MTNHSFASASEPQCSDQACQNIPTDRATLASQIGSYADAGLFRADAWAGNGFQNDIYNAEILKIAQNSPIPGCEVDTRVLQTLLIVLKHYGSASVTELNRKCPEITSDVSCAGSSSVHCTDPALAIDFDVVGGVDLNGRSESVQFLQFLDEFVPSGTGAGQSQCGASVSLGFITRRFEDDCTHQHIDFRTVTGQLRISSAATFSTSAVFSAVVNPNGNQNVFWRDSSNGHLMRVWKTTNGKWSGVIDQGFAIGGVPTAISTGSNNLDVFFADTGGQLRHSYYTGAAWVNNVAIPHIGSNIQGSISAVYKANGGTENVFWRDADGKLEQSYFASGWYPSSALATGLTGSPNALLTATSTDVFFRGAGNAAFHVWYGATWSGVQSLPTGDVSGAITAAMDGDIENVFWRGTGGTLKHIYVGPSTGGWQAPGAITTGLSGDPTAITTQSGIDVLYSGAGNSLNHVWYGSSWSPPLPIPYTGQVASGVAATTDGLGTENAFWVGDGKLAQSYVHPGGQWLPSPPISI